MPNIYTKRPCDQSVGEMHIDHDTCIGCQTCVAVCPQANYEIAADENGAQKSYLRDDYDCTMCQTCVTACPVGALECKVKSDEIVDAA